MKPLRDTARHPERRGALGKPLSEYELPTFSAVVVHALHQVRSPDADAKEVARLLEADPGITVKLLRLCNSASFGLNRAVNSTSHAVALLGRTQVEALLLAVAVGNALPKTTVPELDASVFWCGAARRAATAGLLAEKIDPPHVRDSFTAALLQDMAVPLLAEVHSEVYGQLLAEWRMSGDDLAERERAALGLDHAEVGAWMCEQWRFSGQIMRAIGAHHGIWDETDLPAVTLVSLLTDAPLEYGQARFAAAVEERCQISQADALALLARAEEEAATIAQLFA